MAGEWPWVWCQHRLYSEFQANLGYYRCHSTSNRKGDWEASISIGNSEQSHLNHFSHLKLVSILLETQEKEHTPPQQAYSVMILLICVYSQSDIYQEKKKKQGTVAGKPPCLQVMTYSNSLRSASLFWAPFNKPQYEIKLTVDLTVMRLKCPCNRHLFCLKLYHQNK